MVRTSVTHCGCGCVVVLCCISLADHRLIDVTELALTWVGWPNGKKLALTCVQI